jgi:hypothetical protein
MQNTPDHAPAVSDINNNQPYVEPPMLAVCMNVVLLFLLRLNCSASLQDTDQHAGGEKPSSMPCTAPPKGC